MHRTGIHTFPASDAFVAVWRRVWINVHLACTRALAAVNASVLIYIHPYKAYLLEQSVERPQRTDVFAERPVDKYRGRHTHDK